MVSNNISEYVLCAVMSLQIFPGQFLHKIRPLSFCRQRRLITHRSDSQTSAAARRPFVWNQQILVTGRDGRHASAFCSEYGGETKLHCGADLCLLNHFEIIVIGVTHNLQSVTKN